MATPKARVSSKMNGGDFEVFDANGNMSLQAYDHKVTLTWLGWLQGLPDDAKIAVFDFVPGQNVGKAKWAGNPVAGTFHICPGDAVSIRFTDNNAVIGISWARE